MDNLFNELNKLKTSVQASANYALNKMKSTNDINSLMDEKTIKNFIKNYKYGLITNEQLKNFTKLDNISFEKCLQVAQTNGAICDEKDNQPFCPYIGYRDNTCYLGNSTNDTQNFDNLDGIPVYATPLQGEDDITVREKTTIQNLKKRLLEKQKELNNQFKKQLTDLDAYIKAIDTNKSFEYAKNLVVDESALLAKKLEQKKKDDVIKGKKIEKNVLTDKSDLLSQIVAEKKKIVDEKDMDITTKNNKIQELDLSLNLLKNKISDNEIISSLSGNLQYYLKIIFIIISIISIILIFVFIRYNKH
jgi:hypothetical protein